LNNLESGSPSSDDRETGSNEMLLTDGDMLVLNNGEQFEDIELVFA
jgi:hypothetical protein